MSRLSSYWLTASAAAVVLGLCHEASADFSTIRIAADIVRPIQVMHAPGRPDTLFIVKREGDILLMNKNTGEIDPTPFFTVPDVYAVGEGALVAMAFHPDYENNGKFYVNLTTMPVNPGPGVASTSHVREYTVTDPVNAPNVVDPNPKTLLMIDQPQLSHNGGWMGFSPIETDANLYIMFGDGGGTNDASNGHTPGTGNAQDLTDNLLGKLLRINVDGDDFPEDDDRNYAIPTGENGNPFVGVEGDDEIWAYGIRNAFRGNFDRATGDIYFGDVGQGTREEINFQPASSTGGENYGWRLREGTIQNPAVGIGGPPPPNNVDPIYDYAHGGGSFEGNSVTGGVLYRGPITELQGKYIFGDFVSANIWSFDPADPTGTIERINDDLLPNSGTINSIVAFSEDTQGNLYIVDITGEVFRVGITGDVTGDGFVGIGDLNLVLNHWNEGTPPVELPGDLNGDSFVGIEDLNTVLGNWNMNVTPGDLASGDTNGDGFVGIDDLNEVLGNWNTGISLVDLVPGDIDGNGFVGVADLNIVLGNWNAGTPPAYDLGTIPEPTAVSVLTAGMMLWVRRRNRRATEHIERG